MKSPWIAALRSVALNVPDLARAEAFYTRVWHLAVAQRDANAVYLRGTGDDHHLLALHGVDGVLAAAAPQLRHVTLRARSAEALPQIAQATRVAGGTVLRPPGPADDDPAGGTALWLRDPDGRVLRVVHGDARPASVPATDGLVPPWRDRPQRLAHVVMNSHDVPATQAFVERALGFVLADRTRIMAFMNCNEDHHSLAFADADNDALNHIAFLMPDLESVMRGGGRLRDAGHAIEWGPGRHGPGDNAFNYFIDPFGVVVEYTAEVEQVDDSYRPRSPAEWTWPAGRVDQWGISQPPTARLREAQRGVLFVPTPAAASAVPSTAPESTSTANPKASA